MQSPAQIISHVAATAQTGARFASFTYQAKGTGEVAQHTVALGVSIENAYRRDLALLKAKLPRLAGVEREACEELIASFTESLEKGAGNNSNYTCADVYAPVCKGVKVHKETGALHVSGFSIAKNVISPGVHKTVKSSAKTIAKNALRRGMKSGKFRQFAFESLQSARIDGKTLVFQ